MTTINSIKNRVDVLAPVEEEYIPENRKQMTDKQLMTRIIKDRYGRRPTREELTPEGSSRLIEMLREERDK